MKSKYSKKLSPIWRSIDAKSMPIVRRRPYILPILGVILGGLVVCMIVFSHGGKALKPSAAHVVFLYDNGHKRTVDTREATVGGMIKKLNLNLIKEDVVEPSLGTPIQEDNFRVNVYHARPVTFVDTQSRTVALTAQQSPRTAAVAVGLKIYPEDSVSFAAGDIKRNILGEQVVIDRATPVALSLYGNLVTVRTHSKTVGDLLKEKQVKPAAGDTIQPASETVLAANTVISISRMGSHVETKDENIPPPTQYVDDASLSFGATAIRQAGTPGKKVTTYQIETKNGQEIGRTVLQQVVVSEPVAQVVARGTTVSVGGSRESWMAAAGISGGEYGYVNYIISRESNWNPASLNGSGCAGLGQACPGSKLAVACPGWQNNPVCQLGYFSGYAGRYGGWAGAYAFWLSHHYW
jgi:uncharacterized protein YabE (DUF348 family)